MERITALQQMIDKKNTLFFVYLVNFASFYWEQILSMAPFKISCLGQNLYNLDKPSALAKHW